jgi:hypothetical protein
LSNDRLLQILLTLSILLFISVGAIRLSPGRNSWEKWARWGSIVIFSVAVVHAPALVLRWAFVF